MSDDTRDEHLACEICLGRVAVPDGHYQVTKERPDGFWTCHRDVGRCRCARCEHIWKPRWVKLPLRCPSCGETSDLFWADDGGWERAARGRARKERP